MAIVSINKLASKDIGGKSRNLILVSCQFLPAILMSIHTAQVVNMVYISS